ncbi:MAG TPA: hypothetical protein VGZ71_09740 [Puia sp.]|nr:hypothetical protein [Puia sp.]
MSQKQLEKLTTQRLLAYLRSWLKAHETPYDDYFGGKRELVKSDIEWQEHRNLIKSILAKRGHVA